MKRFRNALAIIAISVSFSGCATLDSFIEDYNIDELVTATANEYVKQKYGTSSTNNNGYRRSSSMDCDWDLNNDGICDEDVNSAPAAKPTRPSKSSCSEPSGNPTNSSAVC